MNNKLQQYEKNIIIIKLIPWAYSLLAYLSIGRYLLYNPLRISLTVFYFAMTGIFFITSFYPVFHTKLHKRIGKYKEYHAFDFFLLYTLILCIYSLVANFPLGNKYEKMALFASWLAVMSGYSVFYLSIPTFFTAATKSLYKIIPFLTVILLPLANKMFIGDMVGFLLMPIILPLLFWKELSKKKKILYGTLAVYVIITSFWSDARSHILKYGIALFLGVLFIRYEYFFKTFRNLVWLVLFIPFILIWLGVSGKLNIFESTEVLKSENLQEGTLADTRTLVYTEALTSAVDNDYIWFGRGIGRGYESYFQIRRDEISDNIVTAERFYGERNSEVSIVNSFTWGGIVYVLIFYIMMCSVIYYGLYRSSNRYVRAVALYFTFYSVYCWVENNQEFHISYLCSWFFIAICLSRHFRDLNDTNFKNFIINTF
ncbi:MAG: hypothetical protein LUD00_04940 [Prevotellaceae bacterium]|nr:hypothetical protein [Prevotellaceae bacterium]